MDEQPPAVDLSRASVARVYDHLLGGKEHLDVDRRAADAMRNVVPEVGEIAKDNRSFLRRGVSYLVREAGIRQIVDIGSGLPGGGNVSEVAHAIDPDVHVVYVDNDAVVLAHARALLATNERTAVVTADLRRPDSLFEEVSALEIFDPDAPFAVLLSGVVHHLSDDDDPDAIVAAIRRRLSPGSHLLLSHFLYDDDSRAYALERAFLHGGLGSGRFRTWKELHGYFTGLELVPPGLVYANDWRPDRTTPAGSPVRTLHVGGIGRKP
ncbi:SAM-dependent methyltransferase [Pseudonocardia adelaidensis]|uniref:SAM-dependent methyltransferase n=1 Tax=Pseudonocardia adelaidensis TaxID=648754 RepID=A0ABP9P7T5_9PSEU